LTRAYAYRVAVFDRLSCLTIGNKRLSEATCMLTGVPAGSTVGESRVAVS